jgi:hypothetical protein
MTTYQRPQERVLFWKERDANPIFHLMESLWILAGRKDVAFVQQFNSKIDQYSDDGKSFNAAYGYRIRHHFGFDQLKETIFKLKSDPETRQCVVQIWEPADLYRDTKDRACNMQLLFDLRGGCLNMTVVNRSNDLWWGAYGANAVHFSVLQEFVAHAVGAPLGVYRQQSNNLHLYLDLYDAAKHLDFPPNEEEYDAYRYGVKPRPIMESSSWERWLIDCEHFCNAPFDQSRGYYDSFFRDVALPMAMVSKVRKDKTGDGKYWASRIEAEDWKLATEQWIERREAAKIMTQLPFDA